MINRMQMSTIMHIVPDINDMSITRLIYQIIQNIEDQSYRWLLCGANHGNMSADFQALGIELLIYGYEERAGYNILRAQDKISKYLEEYQVDLIHVHTPRTAILASLANIRQNKPVLYTKHLLDKISDRSIVHWCIDRVSLYQADYLVPVSKTMAKTIQNYPFIESSKVIPIQNAIDIKHFCQPDERRTARNEFAFRENHIVIGYTGRLEKVKRIDWLLDCFSRVVFNHPEARLLVVGVGSLENKLKAQAKSLRIDEQVVWAGWRTDIYRLLAAMDIYVQSSSNEGLSLSILEAMAAKKPIIATNVGGIGEVIYHGKTGFIVSEQDTEQMVRVLSEMIQDASVGQQVASASYEFVLEHFNIERMSTAYEEVYQRILNLSGIL